VVVGIEERDFERIRTSPCSTTQRNAMQSISEPEAKRAPGTINQPANQPVMRSENTKTKTSNRSRPRETNFEPIHRGSKGIAAPGSDFWNRRLLDKPDANQPTNKSEQANEFIRGDPPKTSDHSVLLSSTITPASQPLDLWMRCGAKSTEKKKQHSTTNSAGERAVTRNSSFREQSKCCCRNCCPSRDDPVTRIIQLDPQWNN